MTTTYWSPNQAASAQVETATLGIVPAAGNWLMATINGKTVLYICVLGDTIATAMTGFFALLSSRTSPAEFNELSWSNPSSGVVAATAKSAGTPFANVSGANLAGANSGLVFSTGNGMVAGIAQAHTKANVSPSDVADPQNWLRVTAPAPGVRQLPQNGDDVVVSATSVPMLWNLGALASVQFNTFTRWQDFTGSVGLSERNQNGYVEWRQTYFLFSGPPGSVPAGGLQMVLGQGSSGSGPTRERYNTGSQQTTLTVLAAGSPTDAYGVRFLGVHTNNVVTLLGGVSLGIAMLAGEITNLRSVVVDGQAALGIGAGVMFTGGASVTLIGGVGLLNSAPDTLALASGAQVIIAKDLLTWATVTMQNNSIITMLAGGTFTNLTMTTGSSLDKSQDARAMTVTNHTIDGDTCWINDPLNAISFTNPGSVKQRVQQGPYRFTGTRTVKVV